MHVIVVEPPEPIVTVAEAKVHLRVEHNDDDTYILALIAAAQGWIDGPAGWLGRSIGEQTLELVDHRPNCPLVRLPFGPILEVLEAEVGAEAVAVTGYVAPSPAFSFGTALTRGDAVRIKYRAGYDEAPAPIKVAVLMLVGQWYARREASTDKALVEMPFAVQALLQPFRVYA